MFDRLVYVGFATFGGTTGPASLPIIMDINLTNVSLEFNLDGTLTTECTKQLIDRRTKLISKVDTWVRSLKFNRWPSQTDYNSLVDELMQIDELICTAEQENGEENMKEVDGKLEQVFAAAKFKDSVPIGAYARNPVPIKDEFVKPPKRSRTGSPVLSGANKQKINLISNRQSTNQCDSSDDDDDCELAQIDLRIITMPTFDDNPSKWFSWWPRYKVLVHTNNNLPYIAKVAKLEECLVGDAKRWLVELKPTKESYKLTIKAMRDYFDSTHVQQAAFNQVLNQLTPINDKYDVTQLRTLLQSANQIMAQADVLDFSEQYTSTKVLPSIRKLLPEELQLNINRLRPKPDTLAKFINALKVEIEGIEQVIADNDLQPKTKGQKQVNHLSQQLSNLQLNNSKQKSRTKGCAFCDSTDHHSARCALSDSEREQVVRSKRLCCACLKEGHQMNQCNDTTLQCRHCQRKHWSFMCRMVTKLEQQITARASPQQTNNTPTPPANNTGTMSNNQLLQQLQQQLPTTNQRMVYTGQSHNQTCLVRIQGQIGRVGFDSCSGHSFMASSTAKRLGLEIYEAPDLGIKRHAENSVSSINNRITTLNLSSLDRKFNITVNVRVVDDLGDMRWQTLSPEQVNFAKTKGVDFVDDESKPVEIIFGISHYVRMVTGKEVKLTDDLLAKKTQVGWLVFGGTVEPIQGQAVQMRHVEANDAQHKRTVKKSDGETAVKQKLQSNQLCKQRYISRNGEEYAAKSQWIEPVSLASSEKTAKVQLNTLNNKLVASGRSEEYKNQFFERTRLGFAEKIRKDSPQGRVYMMPHHDVKREDKDTTKLRIVFDAPSSSTDAKPLNDNLYKDTTSKFGPTHKTFTTMASIYNSWQQHLELKRKNIRWLTQTSAPPWKVHRNPHTEEPSIKVGDKVLVCENRRKRDDWPIASITQLYPSADGIIRSVEIELENGDRLERSTVKLVHPEYAQESAMQNNLPSRPGGEMSRE